MKSLALILSAMLLNVSVASADAISDLAESKCTKCHAADSGFPNLGAQTSEYIFQSLKDYQSAARHSDNAVMMAKKAKGFDDATLKGLADYFSKQPAAAPADGDAAVIAQGKDIYENGIQAKGVLACNNCHGRDGEGNKMSPRLASQLQTFLASQFVAYKDGSIDNQAEMKDIASKLSDDEVTAVTTYLQSK